MWFIEGGGLRLCLLGVGGGVGVFLGITDACNKVAVEPNPTHVDGSHFASIRLITLFAARNIAHSYIILFKYSPALKYEQPRFRRHLTGNTDKGIQHDFFNYNFTPDFILIDFIILTILYSF
jgi:hypothetical protein